MKVLELLSPTIVVAQPDEPLLDAVRKMREKHVGALVVVEHRGGSPVPVGILTDRDVVVGVFAKDASHAATLEVGDVMSTELVTATEDEEVGDVIRRMRSFGVRRLPIVGEGGELRGILSFDDIIVGISEDLAEVASLASQQRAHESERRP